MVTNHCLHKHVIGCFNSIVSWGIMLPNKSIIICVRIQQRNGIDSLRISNIEKLWSTILIFQRNFFHDQWWSLHLKNLNSMEKEMRHRTYLSFEAWLRPNIDGRVISNSPTLISMAWYIVTGNKCLNWIFIIFCYSTFNLLLLNNWWENRPTQ